MAVARHIVTYNSNGTPDTSHRTLGSSGTGDCVLEIDLSKVTTGSQMRALLAAISAELLGLVNPMK